MHTLPPNSVTSLRRRAARETRASPWTSRIRFVNGKFWIYELMQKERSNRSIKKVLNRLICSSVILSQVQPRSW